MNKGKIRTRRLTIRAKILIPSVIIVVLVCGLMGYNPTRVLRKAW